MICLGIWWSTGRVATRQWSLRLQLYSEVNPGMLKKRESGNEVSMDIAGGEQPLPFGYNADTAVDFEGLALLEDHI
ncbi:hypothetical protein BDV98DRAFT_303808 [Pterulicium gracile]|uniref:Uncharacterized protein n=1 Tax=Pterulicium gracile TaxID=1884261 RepID=A0A5C3Q629_9AGAR|nr:hypothetical protein BDV98DRAFT_303808 [Pterula gracilis]